MNKVSYALGMNIGQALVQSNVKPEDISLDDFCGGIKDYLSAVTAGTDAKLSAEEVNQILEEYFTRTQKEITEKILKENKEFLADNAKKEGVQTTPSGLQYKVINQGTGEKPAAHSTVKVHYEGRLINGQTFDSSYRRGEPVSFSLDSVIAGWTEGLQLMPVGSKYELYIPYELGYGEHGTGPIPPYATLIFTVELLEIK